MEKARTSGRTGAHELGSRAAGAKGEAPEAAAADAERGARVTNTDAAAKRSARRPGAAETTAEAEGARRRRDAPMGADARAPRDTAVDAAEGAGRERLRRSTSGSARTNAACMGTRDAK